MKFNIQTILHTAFFTCSIIMPGITAAQAANPEEEIISVDFRTYGLGSLQTSLHQPEMEATTGVFLQQFSNTYTYTGPRKIVFYGSRTLESDPTAIQLPRGLAGDVSTNNGSVTPSAPPAPVLQPAMDVTIPVGMKKALIFVAPSPAGSKTLYRGVVLDDSLTRLDARNIHFYNLTSFPLAVNTFDESAWIAPRQQRRWDVAEDKRISSIMIAVNNPVERVIYSNRFQLSATQRLVFLAYSNGELTPDGFPSVVVTHLLQTFETAQSNPSDLSANAPIELEE